ncbi:MAG: thymidylate synthase [Cetobacterium sp.]
MINIIANVAIYKNKLAIGLDNHLLFKFKEDMEFFKDITTSDQSDIVLMGRNTYFSIPEKFRPLMDRINLVVTTNIQLLKSSPLISYYKLQKGHVYFVTMQEFTSLNIKFLPKVFVIGGTRLYNEFIEHANKLYITHVERFDGKQIQFKKKPDSFMNNFSHSYKLINYSKRFTKEIDNILYKARILTYIKDPNISITDGEFQYLNLMNKILNNGNVREDRTGTGTISLFGESMHFDISQNIPLLTTKNVPFKTVLYELLWMLQGHTDAKILQNQGVKIWDKNSSREFLNSRELTQYPTGVLGPIYGWQWRHFGEEYDPAYSNSKVAEYLKVEIGGFDQLKYVENLLKTDPFSRRIMISAWNPSDMDKMALPPCHVLIQFYVEEINDQKYLSCQFYMRSNDIFLGNPFNLAFYSILTYILAKKCNMIPKEIIYTAGDCHIYKNHIEQTREQLTRTPRAFPKLILNDSLITKDWSEMTVDDFELIGYFPYPVIKAPMAV